MFQLCLLAEEALLQIISVNEQNDNYCSQDDKASNQNYENWLTSFQLKIILLFLEISQKWIEEGKKEITPNQQLII